MPNVLNRKILSLALPNILSNLTVPLLGMVDLALAGHLDNPNAIGGVTIATTLFNLIYWAFSFLRMGTTGLTAQAHGAEDREAMGRTLGQSLFIALSAALLILLCQTPLAELILGLLNPSPELIAEALTYFRIVIWGAPALLATYALNGWLLGMQNSWWPMTVSIITNITNITISALLVLRYGEGVRGIAIGTLVAQYVGALLLAAALLVGYHRKGQLQLPKSLRALTSGLRSYFTTNIAIVLRTLLLASVSLFFTYAGTQQGAVTLATNALLYQFFTLFSYFIDGFAFAAESVVGHYYGMRDRPQLKRSVRYLMLWSLGLAGVVSGLYALFGKSFLGLLTDQAELLALAQHYFFWVLLLPFTGVTAFLYDGIFIGITASRQMVESMLAAVATFFLIFYITPLLAPAGTLFADPNQALWLAFVSYLAVRGIVQYFLSKRMAGLGQPFTHHYILSIGTTHLSSELSIRQLLTTELIPEITFSPFYTTEEIHGSGQLYLNAVASLYSSLPTEELVQRLKEIEQLAGRDHRDPTDVALDLDLVLKDQQILRPHDYNAPYFQQGYRLLPSR